MSLLNLRSLSSTATPEELVTTALWRNWTDRLSNQVLARPVVELAESAQLDLPSEDWDALAQYVPDFPFTTMSKERRRTLILLVATLAENSELRTPHQLVDESCIERLTTSSNPSKLVPEETWSAWCQALQAGESEGRLVGEIAVALGLPWPYLRRHEELQSYLDLTLAEIRAISSIGHKKLRTIVLCVAQAVYELAPSARAWRVESHRSTKAIIEEYLNLLKEDSREVIELRFGLRAEVPHTLADIAEKRDLTRERIRQIESNALRTLCTRARSSSELRKSLDYEADIIWTELVAGHEVIGSDIPDKELANRLSSNYRLSFAICDLPVTAFLDSIAVRVAGGWYRSAVDCILVERVIFGLENGAGGPFPATIEVIAHRVEATIPAVRLAAALCVTTALYKGYVWSGRIGERGRRSIALHRILASMSDLVAVDTAKLVSIHNRIRPYSACSYRDAEMAMARFGHLFIQMGKGAWAASGGIPLPSISEVDHEDTVPINEADKDDTSAEIDSNTAAGAIAGILAEFGPLRMSEIVDHFRDRTDYQAASVGPILLTRGNFSRMAPGVYGLVQHLSDKTARERARCLLLTEGACAEFIRALRAGEPGNRFPLWNPAMEHDWCEWARNSANSDIYTSLLTVIQPQRWEHISPKERDKWQRIKGTDSCYTIDRELNLIPPESVFLRDLLGPIIVAARQSYVGWVTINHLQSNRQNDGKGLAYLGFLIAAGVVHEQEDWRLPHAASDEAVEICDSLLETLCLEGQLRWDSKIGELLKDRIGKWLSRPMGWLTDDFSKPLRAILSAEDHDRRVAAESMTRAIVQLGVAIASADGEPVKHELNRVRCHALMELRGLSNDCRSLVEGFIKRALNATLDPISISMELRSRMSIAERQKLMTHLFAITAEDGIFHESESRLLILLQKNLDIDPHHFEALYRVHAKDPRVASMLAEKLRQGNSQENIEELVSLLII